MDEAQLKKTCLYDRHVALGAKMSPFGGFIMPIQYSSIIAEHMAVRSAVGMFDVSHMGEIFVSGPDAEAFVNYIFTNDVRPMEAGGILYGMMCYPDGGTVDDLLVYKQSQGRDYLLVVNASNIDKDHQWILDNAKGYDVKVENVSSQWGQIAIQGPAAEKTVVDVLRLDAAKELTFYTFVDTQWNGSPLILSRTGYTGEDGFEVYAPEESIRLIWDRLLVNEVVPCGLGCRDTLRFEAGLPLYGDELSSGISPVMAGLKMFCKFEKEQFIGKEALAGQIDNGTARRLVGIELHDKAIPRAGYPVELEDGTGVGVVTTGYHSISLDRSLCFAMVDSEYGKPGTPLWIRIRKKVFPGEVIKKRFYQTNYKK